MIFFIGEFVCVFQLLNQLEGSGAPPAQKDKIDALPTVIVSETQVSKWFASETVDCTTFSKLQGRGIWVK